MSFNLATRINNLQVQINNIEDKGLTNPLTADMDVAGHNVLHVKEMTGDITNGLTLSTDSIAGIILDTDLHSTHEITCSILNYTSLNPPVSGGTQTFSQILASSGDGGGHAITNTSSITTGTLNYTSLNPPIETSALSLTLLLNATYVNEVVTMPAGNPNIGFYTNNSLFNPSIQGNYVFSSISGANSMSIGYTKTPTAQFPVTYGIFFYPEDGYITAIGTQAQFPYTPSTVLVSMQISGKTLHIYINGVLAPVLDQVIPSDNYHMIAFGYADVSCVASNLSFTQGTQMNLSEVLFIGNDGANQNITGINNLTVSNLNYTTLSPPITGIIPTLAQVLTAGNSAGGSNITNVGVLTNTNTTTGVCVLTSNPATEQYQMFGAYSSNKNSFALQQYSGGAVKATPIQINDVDSISFNSASLRYNTNNYILDTNVNVPSLVQAFSITAQQISFLNQLDTVFSMPIYPVSSMNYGIKSMTLEFSMLSLLLTSASNFKEGTQILLYLAESQTNYNSAQGNAIVIIPGSTASYQYNQTFAKLWYTTANATPTNISNLYLCIYFSIDNGIQGCNISSSFLASTMVSTITSNPITWNS